MMIIMISHGFVMSVCVCVGVYLIDIYIKKIHCNQSIDVEDDRTQPHMHSAQDDDNDNDNSTLQCKCHPQWQKKFFSHLLWIKWW